MTSTKNLTRSVSKNVSKNVSSLAHDAAQAASDLGGQAAELGRNAADFGLDAASSIASNVASAASQLAHSLANTVPSHKRRSRKPLFVAALVAAAIAFVVLRSKRSRSEQTTASSARDAERVSDHRSTPAAAMAS